MPDNPSAEENGVRPSFFDFAAMFWQDKILRKAVGDKFSITTKNFWPFCYNLKQTVLDPKKWNDPDYWEEFLEDLDNQMKGGKRERRDIRRGKPKEFWRWAEDVKNDEMSRRTGTPIPPDDIDRWYDEWLGKGKPDGKSRQQIS